MSEKYKIIIEQEGINHIKVFKADGDGFINVWNLPLKGDEDPIVLSELYTETQFIIMNWNGWIRAYDTVTQELLFDHNLNGSVDAKAVLSADKSRLYAALTGDTGDQLIVLQLDSFQIEIVELNGIYDGLLQLRKDGCLLFYKHDWLRDGDKKIYKHFYSVLNPVTKNIEKYELVYAPQFSFGEFKPVVDITQNIVIMPAYDDVVYKTNTEGETLFEFRIALFDLNTFELKNILSVRDFPLNQLGCSEYESEDMAEVLQSTDRDVNYYDSALNFYENLTTIKIASDGFWLCWRGGIVRKINLDYSISPLLVTDTRPNNTEKGLFQHHYFNSHLFHIDNSTIVFAEALDFYSCAMPAFDHAELETPIALHLVQTSLENIYKLSYSKEQKTEIKNRDYIQIEVSDLSKKKGFTDALLQMKTVVSDLTAAGIGSSLVFTVTDTKGKTLQESEFFAEAIEHNPKAVKSLVEKFSQQSKAKQVYRTPEETALCYAVFELTKKDDLYIKTVLQYLAVIDLDHDVFNTENVFPLLEEKYTSKELIKKMKAVSKDLAEWYECYCEA